MTTCSCQRTSDRCMSFNVRQPVALNCSQNRGSASTSTVVNSCSRLGGRSRDRTRCPCTTPCLRLKRSGSMARSRRRSSDKVDLVRKNILQALRQNAQMFTGDRCRSQVYCRLETCRSPGSDYQLRLLRHLQKHQCRRCQLYVTPKRSVSLR